MPSRLYELMTDAPPEVRQMSNYRGISHPAVSAVRCPYCGAAEGVPCRRKEDNNASGTPYVEMHTARLRAYERKLAARKPLLTG